MLKPLKTLYLRESQLLHHPENMRRNYPDAQVAEMAASIRACDGVEQALLVVAGPRRKYYVVDGNLRLEAARRLGAECPPLKCELRSQTDVEQKLTMARTDMHRFPVDPVSRALHYRSILAREQCTVRALSGRLGVPRKVVDDHLLLLRLPPDIQQLVADGQVPRDPRVARALLALPPEAAVKLARHMAGGATIKAILKAAVQLRESLAAARPSSRQTGQEAPALCRARSGKAKLDPGEPPELGRPGRTPAAGTPTPWPDIRQQARQACQVCQVKADNLAAAAEPAWALVAHTAGSVCGDCSLASIASACDACPLVDLLRRMVRQAATVQRHATPT